MPRARSGLKSHLSHSLGFRTSGKIFSFSLPEFLHPEQDGYEILSGAGEMPAQCLPSAGHGFIEVPVINPLPRKGSPWHTSHITVFRY